MQLETQPISTRQFGFEAYMPAIATTALPDETARYVENAYKEVNEGPRVGIIEERDTGRVPVHIDDNVHYAGVTEFRPVYKGHEMDVEAKRIGINRRIRTHVGLGNQWINYKERVARHEFSHMLSEKLLKYMGDITPHQRTLLMESYAEFSDIKRGHKEKVLLTTPYPGALKFAYFADRFYESEIDGKKGYSAFIRDIQKYESARMALDNFGRNIRAAVNSGIDVAGVTESKYRSELNDALRRVDLKPKYAN